MKQENRLSQVAYGADAEGKEVVFVPVHGAMSYDLAFSMQNTSRPRGYAMLDREVFDRLMSEGYSHYWSLNKSSNSTPRYAYVSYKAKGPKMQRRVAQLVMQPRPGSAVRYRNGDRLDLRRCNLWVGSGRSKADCFDLSKACSRDAQEVFGSDIQKESLKQDHSRMGSPKMKAEVAVCLLLFYTG